VERTAIDETERLLCLTNVSGRAQQIALPSGRWQGALEHEGIYTREITLAPYGYAWLRSR
jgi:hypothetical protein